MEKLRVLILSSWGTALPHVMDGYSKALIDLGYEVRLVDVSGLDRNLDINTLKENEKSFARLCKEYAPQLAIGYGTQSIVDIEDYGRNLFEFLKISYVSLFYDNPFMYFQEMDTQVYSSIKNSELYSICVSDRIYIDDLIKEGFDRVEFLPLATSEGLFQISKELDSSNYEQFECDVSFVGSIDDHPDTLRERRLKRLERYPALNKILDTVVDIDKTPSSDMIMQKLFEFKEHMPWDIFAVLSRFAYEESNTMYRMGFVAAIEDFEVSVYGKEGWLAINKPNIKYKGFLDYKKDALALYLKSKINLNITHPQLVTAINQRVFDVSLCGGFVLNDFREDLNNLFGDTVVSYKDISDMKQKIDYYIKNESERIDISFKAKECVLEKHLWKHRAASLMDFLKSKKII